MQIIWGEMRCVVRDLNASLFLPMSSTIHHGLSLIFLLVLPIIKNPLLSLTDFYISAP